MIIIDDFSTPKEAAPGIRAAGHLVMADRMEKRTCGSCTHCCTYKSVHDMKPVPKPLGVTCQHLCENGCGIYYIKPESCEVYYCAWRLGIGNEESRPDKIGVMIDIKSLPDDIVGLVILSQKTYRTDVVGGIIEDALYLGFIHIGFQSDKDDVSGCDIAYFFEEKPISTALALHSSTGRTGWNSLLKEHVNESSEENI